MRLNLGMALSMAGRPREAVPHLQAALKLQPDLLPASLFLGMARMELGQPAQAVEPLQRFVTAQPDHRDARQMLADAELALERYEAAARDYRKLTELGPQDPKAWYGLGRSYEGLSRRAFETLQTSAPDSVPLLLLVAQGLVAQEQDKSAFPLYREALVKKPGLAEAHEALAQIYERSGHPDWAAVERGKAKALPPPDCRAASLECDFRAGRYRAVLEAARPLRTAESRYWVSRAAGELAREAFTRLAGLPPSPEALLVRVDVLRGQRRYSETLEELRKATLAWPEDLRIRRELATLHFIAHEYTAARPLLEDLLKHDPESAELLLLLGEAWVESKEPSKAVPSPREGRSRRPEAPSGPRTPGPRVRRDRTGRARRPSPGGGAPERRGRQHPLPAGPRVSRERPGRPGDPDPRGLPGTPPLERGPAARARKRSSRSRRPEPGSFTRPRRLPK